MSNFQPGNPRTISVKAPRSHATYSRRVTLGAFALIAIIIISTVWVVASMRSRALADASRDLRNLSTILVEQLDQSFQSIEILERSLASKIEHELVSNGSDFAHRYSSEATHQLLKQTISALPHVSALALRDREGQIVSSSADWPARPGLLEPNPAVSPIEEGRETIVGPPSKSPVTGKWAVYLARRVSAPSGEFAGLVLGSMRLDYLEGMFRSIAPNTDSSVALFREDGTLIVRYPSQDSAVGVAFSQRALGHGTLSEGLHEFRMDSPIDGKERLIASRRLPHYPMSVVMTASVDEVLSEWRTAAIFLLAASAIIVVSIAVIVLLIRRQFLGEIVRRNVQFSGAINSITQGVVMFDDSAHVVVCNRQYAQIYRLPTELVEPGSSLLDILRWRSKNGTFDGDAETYVRRLIERNTDQLEARDVQTCDGRSISVLSANLPAGGWISTHEDITDRVKREASFRLLFENNPVPMWIFDQKTLDFIAVNEEAIATYGYTREQFASFTVLDVRPPDAREEFRSWAMNIPPVDRDDRHWRHVTADGRLMDVSIYSQALEWDGRDARLVAIHDVTDQKRGEEQLAKTKRFLDLVIENVPVPIIVKDVPPGPLSADRCTFSLVNRAAEELFGISRSDCIGKAIGEVFADSAGPIARDQLCLQSGTMAVREDESSARFSKKGLRLIRSKRIAIHGDDGKPEHLLSLLEDVTERREAEQRIAYMAHHDVLTGLANRASFDQRFAATLEAAAGSESFVSLLCIDLDGFKEVNDTYGHSMGDAVLRAVADRLTMCGEDAFIARFGGDEFAMVVPDDESSSNSRARVASLLDAMRSGLHIGDHRLQVRLTIGIAKFPEHGGDCETLLGNADLALYRAKALDPGSVLFFSAQLGAEVRDRRAMQEDLKRAILDGGITLHYQPQVVTDGSIIGFEALARWNCPKRGMVSPAIFIEVAEDSNLILALGEFVLRAACIEAAKWSVPHKVAVNISPKQFRRGDLPALVHKVLLQTGLSPQRLELEITEGVLIGDFSRALSILNRLKAFGVEIALDDFGTGFSSLSYLHSFPFDLIKIDRTFVKDVETNRHSQAIVKAVLGLGRSLDVPVLAEGVESQAISDFLFEQGCFAVQGFHFGKPLPAAAYAHALYLDRPIDLPNSTARHIQRS
jgi:diguanylate cyclase (GGDEF)-like protein/PAS domain S-box-containing protein